MAGFVRCLKMNAARTLAAAATALWLASPGLAQTTPAASPPPAPDAKASPNPPPAQPQPAAPAAAPTPAPATPPAAAPVTPAPAAQAPSTQPPATQTPAAQAPATPPAPPPAAQSTTPPASPPPTQTADPFGEELTLTARTVLYVKGGGDWDSAFENITASLKKLGAFLDKQNIKPAGAPLIVYTSTDDDGFTYQAQIPVDELPKTLPKDISSGKSPEGKALKFVHRGSYDNMDNTYEAITNHLDDKKLEAKDMFIEEYVTDPLKTAEDRLVINVIVPLK